MNAVAQDRELLALNEAFGQTALEADHLLESSQTLLNAFTELTEKYAHH